MPQSRLDEILTRLNSLQDELESELERVYEDKRADFQYTLKKGRVQFKKQIRDLQRKYKKGLVRFFLDAEIKHILSAPIIYSIIFPLLFLDLTITLYQHICFRIYGIPLIERSKYLVIDHQYLEYLNVIEKLNCMYCGYGNGLIAYVREIIACTEQYWCPIKHASKIIDAHRLSENYMDYGDAEDYHNKFVQLRRNIATAKSHNDS